MKCDELKRLNGFGNFDEFGGYYDAEVVDAAIAELKAKLAEKDKEIAELKKKLMPCLNGDCILTCEVVEKYGTQAETRGREGIALRRDGGCGYAGAQTETGVVACEG